MRKGLLALVLGLLTLRWLPELPAPGYLLGLAVLGLMLLPWRTYPLALYLLGFSWACGSAQRALDDRLDAAFDGRTLWVEGRVRGLPQTIPGATEDENVVRFELAEPRSRRGRLPKIIRVSWHGGPALHSGERWRLAVQLKRPSGLLNPGGFDYEAWLLAQRIGATGSVKSGTLLQASTLSWRETLRQRLLAVEAQGRQATLAALVLGDDSGLSTADWQILQNTGTVHLLIISGQHVGLLAGLVYALVAGLARYGIWPAKWPWLPWACALAFLAALGYATLAGFEVPARRACAMIGMVLWWRLRYRHLGVSLPLLAAMSLVLVIEPLASLQAGFWLSFGAVGVLSFCFSGRLGAWGAWSTWRRAQWVIALGLLAPMIALGLPISLSGPLANLFAVPWISVVVLPLALLGTVLLSIPGLGVPGEILLWLAGGALRGLFAVLGQLSAWLPAWWPRLLPWWAWSLVASGAVLLLLPKGVPMRLLGWPLLMLWVFLPVTRPAIGHAHVWQLDVGQGLAVLVRTRQHTLLYDAGPRSGAYDSGERIVAPTLRRLGEQRLDLLLLSHADQDHAGGALAVQAQFPAAEVISGELQRLPPSLNAQPCVERSWSWDGVHFAMWQWRAAQNGNQASCVLSIDANGERLLLTGDIDIAAERALLASDFAVGAQWLQAPHHGSRSSSSAAFLAAVAPRGVLVSRGRHNAFGHPHPSVLARYEQLGIDVYDSARSGAIQLSLGAYSEPDTQVAAARFWRAPR